MDIPQPPVNPQGETHGLDPNTEAVPDGPAPERPPSPPTIVPSAHFTFDNPDIQLLSAVDEKSNTQTLYSLHRATLAESSSFFSDMFAVHDSVALMGRLGGIESSLEPVPVVPVVQSATQFNLLVPFLYAKKTTVVLPDLVRMPLAASISLLFTADMYGVHVLVHLLENAIELHLTHVSQLRGIWRNSKIYPVLYRCNISDVYVYACQVNHRTLRQVAAEVFAVVGEIPSVDRPGTDSVLYDEEEALPTRLSSPDLHYLWKTYDTEQRRLRDLNATAQAKQKRLLEQAEGRSIQFVHRMRIPPTIPEEHANQPCWRHEALPIWNATIVQAGGPFVSQASGNAPVPNETDLASPQDLVFPTRLDVLQKLWMTEYGPCNTCNRAVRDKLRELQNLDNELAASYAAQSE